MDGPRLCVSTWMPSVLPSSCTKTSLARAEGALEADDFTKSYDESSPVWSKKSAGILDIGASGVEGAVRLFTAMHGPRLTDSSSHTGLGRIFAGGMSTIA